ncbi:hypothetical protein TanjilG_11132 [Lupinus angustifolius]|uniref:Protein kinase domain-containing protein n=1 Tax=Lupinus angustifolius TaxID=3871 RepID=A0A394DBC4_LUPAN|nr:hypothetical protein TanjilG_11132 [Lupinus angustifolius]
MLSIIASLRHTYLVQLQGWCVDKGELLIVYDFMPNGNLDKMLYKEWRKLLNWPNKFNIVVDLAFVLVYLHQEHKGDESIYQSVGHERNLDRGTKPSLTEAQGPDLIKALGAWNQMLSAGPGLTETGRTRLGVAHRPTGRGEALSQALGVQSGQLGVATLALP